MYDFYEYVVGMHFHFFIYRKTTRSAFCEQENANFVLAKGRVPKRVRKGGTLDQKRA